jgi:tRNA (cmo5U34)-methyltransferase
MLAAAHGSGTTAHVLVVGAGGDAQEIITAGLLEPRWRFTAVDPSPPRMDIAVVNLRKEPTSISAMFMAFPADQQFDAATLIGIFHHQPREDANRAFAAMMTMKKIDVVTIEAARRG